MLTATTLMVLQDQETLTGTRLHALAEAVQQLSVAAPPPPPPPSLSSTSTAYPPAPVHQVHQSPEAYQEQEPYSSGPAAAGTPGLPAAAQLLDLFRGAKQPLLPPPLPPPPPSPLPGPTASHAHSTGGEVLDRFRERTASPEYSDY